MSAKDADVFSEALVMQVKSTLNSIVSHLEKKKMYSSKLVVIT